MKLPQDKIYKVYVNDILVKEYRYWVQAVTYCLMQGYIYQGSGTDSWNFGYSITCLDPRVKIVKEED